VDESPHIERQHVDFEAGGDEHEIEQNFGQNAFFGVQNDNDAKNDNKKFTDGCQFREQFRFDLEVSAFPEHQHRKADDLRDISDGGKIKVGGRHNFFPKKEK
jgi:hypothetical protein